MKYVKMEDGRFSHNFVQYGGMEGPEWPAIVVMDGTFTLEDLIKIGLTMIKGQRDEVPRPQG
jgi:hypothetical protein